MQGKGENVSVIIPAKNEQATIAGVIKKIISILPDAEVLMVDDGSTDATAKLARDSGATVIEHKYSMGNGAAIKTGARRASRDILVFMDADGQHDPEDIPRMLEKIDANYDMVVGARESTSQASIGRGLANRFYNRLASYMSGHRILDLTSGFRAARAKYFKEFIHLLPNGFSYPTTSTMAFFRSGYSVTYIPIQAAVRHGKSHIRIFRDGVKFLLIIFKIGTLYSPLKIFSPIALLQFSIGFGWYIYSYIGTGRFTNMSALLMAASVQIFLIGLISEQVTQLMYSRSDRSGPR